ncbi:MAG: carbon-nitrogen hydrolase family protein [Pseudomonadota bacterium]|nr:carbon-nitrogen hydrolase family protein [Pseudomonadota bacterium]
MTKIAVIQPQLTVGDVESNLVRVQGLIRDAYREHAAEIIVVPEAFTSPNVYAPALLQSPQPIDGRPLQMMRELARELGVIVAGGFVAIRGRHTYGTYILAEPDGTIHLHDKDIPTAWEQGFYMGGQDDGVIDCATLSCKIGLMSGWEWARFGTSARVHAAGAQLVIGGMCWYSMPINWYGSLGTWMRREHARYCQQSRDLPAQVARLTGVPVAHAAHVGLVSCNTPLLPRVRWLTEMTGESQICDREGRILARLGLEDGEGHVAADVTLAAPQPIDPIPDRYWIIDHSIASLLAWHVGNLHGTISYRVRHTLNRFPWQHQV